MHLLGGVPASVAFALILIGIGSAASVAVREAGHPHLGGLALGAAACVGGTLVSVAIRRSNRRRDANGR